MILVDPNVVSVRAERGLARAQSKGQLVDGRKARAAATATAQVSQPSPRGRNQHKRQLDPASAVKSAASAVKRSRNVPTTSVDLIVKVGATERWKVTVTPGQTPRDGDLSSRSRDIMLYAVLNKLQSQLDGRTHVDRQADPTIARYLSLNWAWQSRDARDSPGFHKVMERLCKSVRRGKLRDKDRKSQAERKKWFLDHLHLQVI